MGEKVQRPRYNDLNPFRYFYNENDFKEGNQRLQPNFYNNFNLNYTFNSEYFFDFYYRDNGNYISALVFQDNDALTLREFKQNVIGSISYGLDFTLSKSIVDPWFLYAYTSVFYEEETFLAIESGNVEFTNSIDGFYIYLANYLTLSRDGTWTGEVTFSHFSRYLFGSYVQSPSTNLTLGLRKSLWDNRAAISVAAEDLLGLANPTYTSRYLNQDNAFLLVPETQFVRVGFTYNFGNFRLEQNKREIEKDERERLGRSSNPSTSAINKLVSRVPPLLRLLEKARYFPLLENTGKASKVSPWVTRSKFFPSVPIRYRLKGNPRSASKLLENKIFSPDG